MNETSLIHDVLSRKLTHLYGPWVLKPSAYEKQFVQRMGRGWEHMNSTDCDCTYYVRGMEAPLKVELKKCQRLAWFNLLRYTSKAKDEAHRNFTVVLFYNKKEPVITEFVVIPTPVLQARLFDNFPSVAAIRNLERLPTYVPRQINAQVNLTRRDLQECATRA